MTRITGVTRMARWDEQYDWDHWEDLDDWNGWDDQGDIGWIRVALITRMTG